MASLFIQTFTNFHSSAFINSGQDIRFLVTSEFNEKNEKSFLYYYKLVYPENNATS